MFPKLVETGTTVHDVLQWLSCVTGTFSARRIEEAVFHSLVPISPFSARRVFVGVAKCNPAEGDTRADIYLRRCFHEESLVILAISFHPVYRKRSL